jgi:type II secretory pathway component HofQ
MRFLFAFALLLLIGRETYGQQPQNLRMAEIQVRLVTAKSEQIQDIFVPPTQEPATSSPLPSTPFIYLSGVMTNEQLQKSLEQLAKAGARISDYPKLLTLSGREARIENVRRIPYPSEYEPQDANNKTVPTSFSSTPDGLIMEFKPTVEDDMIDLELSLTLKKLNEFVEYPKTAPASNAVWQPSFSTSEVKTSLSIYSGQTAVLAQSTAETKDERMFILISVREIPAR